MAGNALIRSSSGKETEAQLVYRSLALPERRARALKILGLCWGGSILTLPLPPIHWVTVPGLFLLGPVLALKRFRHKEQIQAFSFSCPECGQENHRSESDRQDAFVLYCTKCGYTLRLTAHN